jgi:hypothetical protein
VSESKSIVEMIGEMFREAAVLVTVFVPLDVVVAFCSSFVWKEIMLLIESAMMVGAAFGILGVAVERTRRR